MEFRVIQFNSTQFNSVYRWYELEIFNFYQMQNKNFVDFI